MRTLYQFPLSHFCEKARWLLDHKELEYVAQNLTPGLHRAFTQLKTGQNYLPILNDHQHWVANSTQIALYLDENYPEHPLLSQQPRLREKILEMNALSVELGQHVRVWGLAQVLASDESMEILIGEKGYLRKFSKYSKPLMKTLITKGYRLDTQKVTAAKEALESIVTQLNAVLVDNPPYLVGERLSLADIAVCSMLAPILELPGTPWERENIEQETEQAIKMRQWLSMQPVGQYVSRLYATERHARIDWRGI